MTELVQSNEKEKLTLTLIFQELSHFTSLKFFPKLKLLLMKHTLRIFTAPAFSPSTSVWPLHFCCGSPGTGFQVSVPLSPDISTQVITEASSSQHQICKSREWYLVVGMKTQLLHNREKSCVKKFSDTNPDIPTR